VPVTIDGIIAPNGTPASITVTGIFQDEPTDTTGDGNSAIDGHGVGTPVASVRAERIADSKNAGNGRVYEIQFTATDGTNTCSGSVKVGVPAHHNGTAIDDGLRYNSTVRLPVTRNP
jgi:hypothetical protein